MKKVIRLCTIIVLFTINFNTVSANTLGSPLFEETPKHYEVPSTGVAALLFDSCTLSKPTATVVAVSCDGGNDGSIDITLSSGTPPYTFLWSNGSTNEDQTGLSRGTYTVTVTDSSGCTESIARWVNSPPNLLLFATTVQAASCGGLSDGIFNTSVSGGTAPYSFMWSDGSTIQNRNDLSRGTYTVTVTDANACSKSIARWINAPVAINVLATSVQAATCGGGTDGIFNISASGGVPPYSFLWSNGSTAQNQNALSRGTYTVTVSDANGCSKSIARWINSPVALSLQAGTVENVSCFNGSDGVFNTNIFGGTAPYSYLWSDGGTTANRNDLNRGTWYVTATDANGCSKTIARWINHPSPLNISANATDPSSAGASDGSIGLGITGGVAPYTYSWSDGSGPLSGCDAFIAQNGLAIVEFESATPVSDWTLETYIPNYTDQGYLEWKTGNGGTGVDPAGTGTLTYNIHISTAGQYRLIMRTSSPEFTDHNDVWARFPDNGGLAIKSNDTIPLGTGWFKVYQNSSDSNWTWLTKTVDFNPYDIYTYFDTPGTYRFEISGRSTMFKVDRFSLFHSSVHISVGANINNPESPYGLCMEDSVSSLAAGTYTVIVTDANGCTASQSIVLGAGPRYRETVDNAVDFKVFPNPSNEEFNIVIKGGQDPGNISIIDILGKTIEGNVQRVSADSYSFGKSLSSGIYFVKIELQNKTEILKVIKQE